MRRTLLSLLLVILAVGPLRAQDDPRIDRPPRPGKDDEKIKFVDPKEDGAKPAARPGGDEKPKPEPAKDGLDALIAALDDWPASTALAAIDALVQKPEETRPRLLSELAGKIRNRRCGAAVALSKIGKKEDAGAILLAARDRRLSHQVYVLLEAADRLDPAAAKKAAFAILAASPRPAQRNATKFVLEKGLRAEDRPAVEALMSSNSAGARLSGIRLLTRAYPIESVIDVVLAALDDRSQVVCAEAAKLLSGLDGAHERLRKLARSYDSRPAAYAALSLALLAQSRGVQPFDTETIEALIGGRGLQSIDPLSRGVAAIVLGHVGYEQRVAEIDVLMESAVVPTLLDNIGGSRFFRDQPSLVQPSSALLGKLTGQSFGRDVRGWRMWWSEARKTFVARRKLSQILPRDLAALDLDLEIPGGLEMSLSTRPEALTRGALIVEPEVIGLLIDSLRSAGFFGDEWEKSWVSGALCVRIRVGPRERIGSLPADRVPADLGALSDRLKAIRARCLWQRYWDVDDYPRAADFIRARASWFAPDTSPAERDAHLRIVIAEALDDLPRDERLQALAVLEKLPGPPLDDRLSFALILLAEAEKGLTPFSEATIRFLVSERSQVIRKRLTDFLAGVPGPRAMNLLAESLAALGREAVLAALGDTRSIVRRAGVRGLAQVKGEDAVERLRALLRDTDHGVRLEALTSLGTLEAREALLDIERAAKDETRDDLRAAALRALGAVGGKTAVPVLVDALRSKAVAVRVAAIQGLGATGHEDAVVPLLYAMQRDPFAGVVEVAAGTLVELGGEPVAAGLLRLATDINVRSSVRLTATRALGRLGKREALVGLLDRPLLAQAAALALAELRDGRAVPKLLQVLASGTSRRVLPALEGLTARTFGVRPRAEITTLFIGWWEVHKDGNPTSWLLSALRDRGYEVAALENGGDEKKALGVLIRALEDESWAIRYSSSRELEKRTGQDFGRLEKFTSHEDARTISDLWRRWWAKR